MSDVTTRTLVNAVEILVNDTGSTSATLTVCFRNFGVTTQRNYVDVGASCDDFVAELPDPRARKTITFSMPWSTDDDALTQLIALDNSGAVGYFSVTLPNDVTASFGAYVTVNIPNGQFDAGLFVDVELRPTEKVSFS
jgi:hypothetical protein